MADGYVTDEMCGERSGNIKSSVDHLHVKFDKLDKDLRNGISTAIQANSKMLERHDASADGAEC